MEHSVKRSKLVVFNSFVAIAFSNQTKTDLLQTTACNSTNYASIDMCLKCNLLLSNG